MPYRVTKTYGHNEGWSVAFRQWRAESHCRFIHGYALSFAFTFESDDLDAHNWCLDFGSLKPLKDWLREHFDHRLVVAEDDPDLAIFRNLHESGIADCLVVSRVSCEAFAELAAARAFFLLRDAGMSPRVRLISVEVAEHSGNSATYVLGAPECSGTIR